MSILSQRGYARHRGVAVRAVQKAISSGRISTEADGSIDSEKADREWEQNTMQYAPSVTGRKEEEGDEPSFSGGSQYTKARAVREHYQARIARIEYEERSGKLLPRDEVQTAAFNTYRQFRDHMMNIPDRLAATLAAEADAAKCHALLVTEIRRALNEFADSVD